MLKEFYPTPSALAYKACAKFKNKKIVRLLEPSAGRGDLIAPLLDGSHYKREIDCIEIDLDNQAILRGKKLNVIDSDFMQFTGAGLYSHIILNPPFSQGADHVIKAFELLVSGELVAIVNAETVKNQHTSKRRLLGQWIEEYGDVEFIEQAFTDPDTFRKTSVEIALIWMEKKVDIKQNFTHKLNDDKSNDVDYDQKQELAIKNSSISNAVAVFNASVSALKSFEIAQEEAIYYRSLLGMPFNQMHTSDIKPDDLQSRFNKGYDDLKDRAWANILQSTDFSKYLSSKAYTKLVADFESVKKLSFTESNIRGFLIGLIQGQSEMNIQMLLDCFDEITKYIPENRAYYRGWKSNQKHKDQAYKVQMTRFIIPRVSSYYSGNVSYETIKKLEDFDKTFAMLDGKAECEVSLSRLFSDQSTVRRLESGERLSSTYFDCRYYPGVGTIHFFPTNKFVIDRLNRLVGKERQWLPNDDNQGSKAFWQQFEKAESITRKMVLPKVRYGGIDESKIPQAHLDACEKMGIDVASMLTQESA